LNTRDEARPGVVSEERSYQLLVEAVHDYAIYMLDPQGYVASWNPGAARIKGYTADEILGRHFSCFYTEGDRQQRMPETVLRIALETGKYETEAWRVRKDGQLFWASVVIDPILDGEGRHVGFAKITRDITERKKAQDALRESEQRFQLLVQGVTDYAIYMLDLEGHVTNWNSGAARIKGYTADEILGRHFSCFYTAEDQEAGVPKRALETAAREGKCEMEGWRVHKDGRRFWASIVIDPIYNGEGRLIGFAKVTRDITERKKAQEELDQARAALFQSQKMETVGQLTGGIAHDFNNLLQVIIGNLELLQRSMPDESGQMQKRVANAMHGAKRAATLTQQLLAFSRRQPLSPRPTDVNQLVLGMSGLLDRTLGETVEVRTVLADALWQVEVDANQLESALINLAVNARDAMPGGGRLTIETANVHLDEEYTAGNAEVRPGRYVVICVSDTGSGMTKEVLERAFEPFFTTKEVGRGTGLGLSQVYGFVAQSGGHVKIQSEAGEGTAVRIYLPHLAGAAAAEPPEAGPDTPKGRNTETVLVVEDDQDVRRYTVEVVRELGYQVIGAPDGPSALDLLRRRDAPVTLLFTDVVLPGGMDGRELAAEARRRHPELKVLFTTGYARGAVGAGAAGSSGMREGTGISGMQLVPKPFSYADLALKIRAALDGKP
jgi:PAS domain S-box-containing protein